MLLSNLKGVLRQSRQADDYVGRHRAPDEPDEAPATRLIPATAAPIVPGVLAVPAPRPAAG